MPPSPPPTARPPDLTDEQILEKLLALNLERAAEEAKSKPARGSREKQPDELG
jgi:hypothetical protein